MSRTLSEYKKIMVSIKDKLTPVGLLNLAIVLVLIAFVISQTAADQVISFIGYVSDLIAVWAKRPDVVGAVNKPESTSIYVYLIFIFLVFAVCMYLVREHKAERLWDKD